MSKSVMRKQEIRERPWAGRLAPPIVMMGVPFDQVSVEQTLGIVREMIEDGGPHLLATANVDFLAQVQEDEGLRRILVDADLVVCDGTPLVWMSRLLGDALPERVAGSDLVPLLLDLAAGQGYRVYFLGGRDEVLGAALEKIRERWPALEVAGMYSPPFAPLEQMDHGDICRRIREARADMLFVSFGCPKQEKWLARNYREAGVPVAVGVGATIDFLAGAVKRAPMWMRKTGLEWFYRVMQEPKRLAGRYWKDIRVVGPGLVRQFLTMRPRSGVVTVGGGWEEGAKVEKELAVLVLPERLDALAARDGGLWGDAEAGDGATLIADARATVFLDSTGTGRLIRFARMARERGGAFILAGPTVELLRTLDLMKLRGFFTIAADMESAVVLAEKMNEGRA